MPQLQEIEGVLVELLVDMIMVTIHMLNNG